MSEDAGGRDGGPVQVRCDPDGVDVTACAGARLLDALVDAGVPITHACGGRARCSTCRVRVVDGLSGLGERTVDEQQMASRLGFGDDVRLACRAQVLGPAAVRRLVIDEVDVHITAQTDASGARADARGAVGRDEVVSVMFSDVAGFTPLSEHLPPYDVIHLLDRHFHLAGDAVAAYGGRIDNYMGDGFMALFEGEDHAARAVAAGQDVVRAARVMDRYVRSLYECAFAVRVGIHCGEVVVGEMGSHDNRRVTAIGDVVNVASRVEAANKEAGTHMLVTDAVRERASAAATWGRTVSLRLKGKSEPFTLHEVPVPDESASA